MIIEAYDYLIILFSSQIAEELPAEVLNEYKEIFSFFDRDGGGSIGAEEFDQVDNVDIFIETLCKYL